MFLFLNIYSPVYIKNKRFKYKEYTKRYTSICIHKKRILVVKRELGCRIFTDIHVSGHAAREDLRDMINLVKPKHIIPAHGEPSMLSSLMDLAIEMGYEKENVHLMRNGRKLSL